MKTPVRRLKQTNFCRHFSSWQTTATLQIFITILTKFLSFESRSPQRCPCLTGNLRTLSCLKTFCERTSTFTTSRLKMTESTTSILSEKEMLYRQVKKLTAQGPIRENLGEHLAVFRSSHVKLQSMTTSLKHSFLKLIFYPANQKLVDFLDQHQKLANDALGIAGHAVTEQFLYAKLPSHFPFAAIEWPKNNFSSYDFVGHELGLKIAQC